MFFLNIVISLNKPPSEAELAAFYVTADDTMLCHRVTHWLEGNELRTSGSMKL